MGKIAFLDLDGVVADSTARFEQAKVSGKIDWSLAFAPEHVHLDMLMENAPALVERLYKAHYVINFLTSRPESMREATQDWLATHFTTVPYHLIMKPRAAQYLKTPPWKAATIELLATYLHADAVLVIDDETVNHDALTTEDTSYDVCVTNSLVAAVALIEGNQQDDDEHPF